MDEVSGPDECLREGARSYARGGSDRVSLRRIARRVGFTFAELLKRFGSKERFLIEMIGRNLRPLNAERLALLQTALDENEGAPLPLEAIIDALVLPMARRVVASARDLTGFSRSMSYWYSEPVAFRKSVYEALLRDGAARFVGELKRSLPLMAGDEVERRFQVTSGAMLATFMGVELTLSLRNCEWDEKLVWEQVYVMRDFICAGLRAPLQGGESDKIFLEEGNRRWCVLKRSIRSVRADGNYSRVSFRGGHGAYVRRTMSEWESLLGSEAFIRINRGAIINQACIVDVGALPGDRLKIRLRGEDRPYVVSRRKSARLAARLDLGRWNYEI